VLELGDEFIHWRDLGGELLLQLELTTMRFLSTGTVASNCGVARLNTPDEVGEHISLLLVSLL
jgi:hypothetical protein